MVFLKDRRMNVKNNTNMELWWEKLKCLISHIQTTINLRGIGAKLHFECVVTVCLDGPGWGESYGGLACPTRQAPHICFSLVINSGHVGSLWVYGNALYTSIWLGYLKYNMQTQYYHQKLQFLKLLPLSSDSRNLCSKCKATCNITY